MTEIYKTMEKHCGHWKINSAFHNEVKAFKDGWIRKGEHLDFLIGGTIGTQDVVFSITDDQHLMQEVLKVDMGAIRHDIKHIDAIEVGGLVLANPKFHALFHLMRRIYTSDLKDEKKIDFILDVYSIFFFMRVSSKLTHDFAQGKASPDMAYATYEGLSNQFIIKRVGSWMKVIEYVANDFYPRRFNRKYINGIYYERCLGRKDKDITEVIMGSVTKINEYLVNVYGAYIKTIESGGVGGTSSKIMDFGDEGGKFQDVSDMSKHNAYLNEIISLKTDFVNKDLLEIISNLNGGIPEKNIHDVLNYLSDDYLKDNRIREIINIPVTEAINYLILKHVRVDELTNNLEEVLEMIRGKWLAGKGQTEDIYKFKRICSDICKDVTKKKTHHFLTNITILIGIYIFLRAIVGNRLNK